MNSLIQLSDAQKNQVETCLLKIQVCAVFKSAPRQFRLLKYLIHHTMKGSADRLMGYTIAVEVFERPPDFNPAIDSIVRVEAGKLRAKLREYYADYGQQDAVHFMLPKGSYCLDIKHRTLDLNLPSTGSFIERRKNVFNAVHSTPDSTPSLAILPFVNLSSSPVENNYLVDGLVDTLTFLIARLSGLLVLSRQSTFCYRGSSISATQIGAELGVRYLVEGAVQQVNNSLRVTVNLIDTMLGGHIWSGRFESNLNNIFEMQDKVALSIGKALNIKILGEESALFGQEETNSFPALDAVLRGLQCHWKYSPKSITEARNHFAQAVEYDPAYAATHAWLARSILHQLDHEMGGRTRLARASNAACATSSHVKPKIALCTGYIRLGMSLEQAARSVHT